MLRLHQGGAVAEASDIPCNAAMGEQPSSDQRGTFSPGIHNPLPVSEQVSTSSPFSPMGKLSHGATPQHGFKSILPTSP